jgi:menaquinone-dependent protoporphyrinogen oxidase
MTTKRILVAYTTHSGSTADVAQAVGEELSKQGAQVDVSRLEDVVSLEPYTATVIGAPMILGWHRAAVRFVKVHQDTLSKIPVAYFLMAMSLTRTGEESIGSIPVYVDAGLAKPPEKEGRLSFKERYATVSRYLNPVLKAAPAVRPVSVGFFGGRLDLFRLKLLPMLFVLLVIRAQPGEKRNWPAIREWASGLYPKLLGAQREAGEG